MSLEQKKYFESGSQAQQDLVVEALQDAYSKLSTQSFASDEAKISIMIGFRLALKIVESKSPSQADKLI